MKYYTTEKAVGGLLEVAGSGGGVCQVSWSFYEADNSLKSQCR